MSRKKDKLNPKGVSGIGRDNSVFVKRKYKPGSRCYYCNCVMEWSKELVRYLNENHLSSPDNLATCEHLISQNNIFRFLVYRNKERYMVLACYKCNQEKSTHENEYTSYVSLIAILKTNSIIECVTTNTKLIEGNWIYKKGARGSKNFNFV